MRLTNFGQIVVALLATGIANAQTPSPSEVAKCRSIEDSARQWACFNALNAKHNQLAKPGASAPLSDKPDAGVVSPSPNQLPTTPETDSDAYVGLPFTPRGFGQSFDDVAVSMDLDQRSQLINCKSGGWTVCTFKIPEFATVMITGKAPDQPARDVLMIIGTPDDEKAPLMAVHGLLDWGVLITMLDPKITASRRGDLIKKFLDGASRANDKPLEFKTPAAEYSLAATEGMGIWLSAKKSP